MVAIIITIMLFPTFSNLFNLVLMINSYILITYFILIFNFII